MGGRGRHEECISVSKKRYTHAYSGDVTAVIGSGCHHREHPKCLCHGSRGHTRVEKRSVQEAGELAYVWRRWDIW